MNKIFFGICILCVLLGCRKDQPPDPRINDLQKEVAKLSAQTKELESEIRILRQELEEEKAKELAVVAQQQTQAEKQRMTVDRAKRELDPMLKESIVKLKKQLETPPKGKSFGIRVEYDVPRAIYGLQRTDNPAVPYRVKVIVRYEKYLESEKESKTYGGGSTTFIFGNSKNRWVLEKTE